jgi:hypothetical protein
MCDKNVVIYILCCNHLLNSARVDKCTVKHIPGLSNMRKWPNNSFVDPIRETYYKAYAVYPRRETDDKTHTVYPI